MTPENLRDAARVAYDRELAKQNLQTAMTSRLTASHRDGVFKVDAELFVLLNLSDEEEMVLLDIYHIPVLVNRKQLYDQARKRYQEIMNQWLHEYQQQVNVRSAKQL